jgi:hypothetical protein
MDFTLFAVFVTIAALIYAFIARELQYRFGNRKEMEDFQAKAKILTDEMNDAAKRKDSKKIDELMIKQAEHMKQMTGMMLGSFKVMFLVLGVFFVMTWGVSQLDPTIKDDITIKLLDDGKGCDLTANDGNFTVCYTPKSTNGTWSVFVKANKADGGEFGENGTYFYYAVNDSQAYAKGPKAAPVGVSAEPKLVPSGGQVTITAAANGASEVYATLDNGTRFYVDLPIAIPILDVKRINETYWWFIFTALIGGLVISYILGQLRKMKKA